MTHFVKVLPRPIEVIDHTKKFAQAAWRLATENCAFIIPPYVGSNDGPITDDEHKLEWLVAALSAARPTWGTIEHSARRIDYGRDIGMHGNP